MLNGTEPDAAALQKEQAFADLTGRSSACVINHGGISVALLQRAGPFSGAAAADKVFDLAREKGADGIVIKDSESTYRAGKSDGWYRRKVRETLDLPIVSMDFTAATGVTRVRVNFNGTEIDVYAGTGREIGLPPFASATLDTLSLNAPMFAEIAHLGITSNGSLRSPSFLRWRTDKQETPHV